MLCPACWVTLLLLCATLLGPCTAAFASTFLRIPLPLFQEATQQQQQGLPRSSVVSASTKQHRLAAAAAIMAHNDASPNVFLEVEQKFALLDGANLTAVEETLSRLGMERKGDVQQMVDWYFDLPAPRWVLTPKDCWLRYRDVRNGNGGEWQLKQGRQHEGGSTVYQEMEGPEAVKVCVAMLPPNNHNAKSEEEEPTALPVEEEAPKLPTEYGDCGLVPFARIETRRSSWCLSQQEDDETTSPWHGLTVDLDVADFGYDTDFGYMVGEVEAVVSDDKEIKSVRRRIEALISKLVPNQSCENSGGAAIGKLEFFLMTRKRDHYEMCVKTGSIVPERGSQTPNGSASE